MVESTITIFMEDSKNLSKDCIKKNEDMCFLGGIYCILRLSPAEKSRQFSRDTIPGKNLFRKRLKRTALYPLHTIMILLLNTWMV